MADSNIKNKPVIIKDKSPTNKKEKIKAKLKASSVPSKSLPVIQKSRSALGARPVGLRTRNLLATSYSTKKGVEPLLSVESEYIRNLQQQVYLLELEVEYLREKNGKLPLTLAAETEKLVDRLKLLEGELLHREDELTSRGNTIQCLHEEKDEERNRYEIISESYRAEKKELINEIVSLKKQVERFELDETRRTPELEKAKHDLQETTYALHQIEGRVKDLHAELDEKDKELERTRGLMEVKQADAVRFETQFKQQEDKCYHAEQQLQIDSLLKRELKDIQLRLKEKEIQAEQDRSLRLKISEDCGNLVKENAGLASQLLEVHKQLELERSYKESVRLRKESTIEELVKVKEEVKMKSSDMEAVKQQLSNYREKCAELSRKLTTEEEEHVKYREKCLSIRHELDETSALENKEKEENIRLKRDNHLITDRVEQLSENLSRKSSDYEKLKTRFVEMENQMSSIQSKLKLQSNLDTIRWDEFDQLADQMKHFSRTVSPIRACAPVAISQNEDEKEDVK